MIEACRKPAKPAPGLHCFLRTKAQGTRRFLLAILIFVVAGNPVLSRRYDNDLDHPNTYIGNAGWNSALELWAKSGHLGRQRLYDPAPIEILQHSVEEEAIIWSVSLVPRARKHLLGCQGRCPQIYDDGRPGAILERTSGMEFLSRNKQATARLLEDRAEVQAGGWLYRYIGGSSRR